MKTITLLLSFLSIFYGLKAQTVTVTDVVQDGQKLVVSYDITEGTGNYEVSLFCSTDDGTTWAGPLRSVSGDVGKNIPASIGKKITWVVLNDWAALDGNKIRFKIKASKGESTVTDIDGNTYETVKIGTQIWMKENLKSSRYGDGSPIPTGLSDSEWSKTNSGAYAIYDNDQANKNKYGKLYNWYAVTDRRGLCPANWHVPSDKEWNILEYFLGGKDVAGGKMKTTTGWNDYNGQNGNGTNESGFSGLPGSSRNYYGIYFIIGNFGYWWSSTENSTTLAWGRHLNYNYGDSFRIDYLKQAGFSVRCLRD
jgi:uncharacterized protein (TIGR02145 family)